jgi:hypothetical protein
MARWVVAHGDSVLTDLDGRERNLFVQTFMLGRQQRIVPGFVASWVSQDNRILTAKGTPTIRVRQLRRVIVAAIVFY